MFRIKKTSVFIGCGIALFMQGCAGRGDFAYIRRPVLPEEEIKTKVLPEEEKEEWFGSFLEREEFAKQCPVCQRRYSSYRERCPYDGAELTER